MAKTRIEFVIKQGDMVIAAVKEDIELHSSINQKNWFATGKNIYAQGKSQIEAVTEYIKRRVIAN